jgi:hypothetical protein
MQLKWYAFAKMNRGSVVGLATAYGFDDPVVEVRVPVGSRILSFQHRQDWLRGSPNFLRNE